MITAPFLSSPLIYNDDLPRQLTKLVNVLRDASIKNKQTMCQYSIGTGTLQSMRYYTSFGKHYNHLNNTVELVRTDLGYKSVPELPTSVNEIVTGSLLNIVHHDHPIRSREQKVSWVEVYGAVSHRVSVVPRRVNKGALIIIDTGCRSHQYKITIPKQRIKHVTNELNTDRPMIVDDSDEYWIESIPAAINRNIYYWSVGQTVRMRTFVQASVLIHLEDA